MWFQRRWSKETIFRETVPKDLKRYMHLAKSGQKVSSLLIKPWILTFQEKVHIPVVELWGSLWLGATAEVCLTTLSQIKKTPPFWSPVIVLGRRIGDPITLPATEHRPPPPIVWRLYSAAVSPGESQPNCLPEMSILPLLLHQPCPMASAFSRRYPKHLVWTLILILSDSVTSSNSFTFLVSILQL